LNRYAYVNDNPLGFVDPSGEAGGIVGWGGVCKIGGSIDKSSFMNASNEGGLNFCNPIVSIISAVIVQTGLAKSLGILTASANTVGKQISEVSAYVNAAFTIACSVDNFNSAMCGPSGWTTILFGKDSNVGKGLNDAIALTGAILCGTGPGSPECIGYAIYSVANAAFSWIWSAFSGPQFTGSLLPRPAAMQGLGTSPIGIPDKNLRLEQILGQASTGEIPTPAQ
jgi:hypothetical protein